jgi:hypothetical protein
LKKYSLNVEIILSNGTRERECIMIASLLKCKLQAKIIKKIFKKFVINDPLFKDSEIFIFIDEMRNENEFN